MDDWNSCSFSKPDRLLQLYQDFTTYKQHSSVCVWNVRLQPHLCLHSKLFFFNMKHAHFVVKSCVELDHKKSWCKTSYAVFYLLYSRRVKSEACSFLPLSPLSSLAEAQTEYMCIILLSPVLKGNGSKYLMHVIRLYKNWSSFQSFSPNSLKPFKRIHNKHSRDDLCFSLTQWLTEIFTVGQVTGEWTLSEEVTALLLN